MKVGVISLGCSKNRVDTEMMLGILRRAGYEITANEADADILIVNTCGFIESAKQESIDTLLSLTKYREKGHLRLLVATGCLSQRYPEDLAQGLPEVDAFLGVNQYEKLPEALAAALRGDRPVLTERDSHILCESRVLTTPPYTAYTRIADGCDNRCAYCAIPLIRGGFRSVPMEEVLSEIRALAAQGVKEHVLIAQDTSRYGIDFAGRSLLPELMERAADIPGVEWLRVLYCYPDEVDESLLRAMAAHPNICKYLDLPLQHADPEMLHRMNRRGDISRTEAFLQKARDMGFTLRTTCITGFPGETEAQFETLLRFVERVRFDRLGAFAFSPEDDTPAAEMADQLPEEVKEERLDRLMRLQQGISLERNQMRIGEECKVLVERVRENGVAVGRSPAEAPETDGEIYLSGVSENAIGEFIPARITDAMEYDLFAEPTEEAQA